MKFLKPFLLFLFILFHLNLLAQKSTANADKNCGCNYFPLCNYDLTKSYAGVIYKGIRYDDESITYYHCENGILTAKWQWVHYNSMKDEYDNYNYTRILLKENAKVGEPWTNRASDGRFYTRYIVKRHSSFTVDGETYNDVIQVRQLDKQYDWKTDKEIVDYYEKSGTATEIFAFGWQALYATDYYYARGKGEILRQKITDEFIDETKAKVLGPPKQYNLEKVSDIKEYLMAHEWFEPWGTGRNTTVFLNTYVKLGNEVLGNYHIENMKIIVDGMVIFNIITDGIDKKHLFNLQLNDKPKIILEPSKKKM